MPGVFWLIDDELLTFLFDENADLGLSKSGRNYNHKQLWDHVKPDDCDKAFGYYPRGRVEINGRREATVYMSLYIDEI